MNVAAFLHAIEQEPWYAGQIEYAEEVLVLPARAFTTVALWLGYSVDGVGITGRGFRNNSQPLGKKVAHSRSAPPGTAPDDWPRGA